MDRDVVGGPVDSVGRYEALWARHEMKTGKTYGLSDVSLELMAASGEVEMVESCQMVLDGLKTPTE